MIGAGMPRGCHSAAALPQGRVAGGYISATARRFRLRSDQGRALNALPAGYKADWGITTLDGAITLPNLFSEDGARLLFAARGRPDAAGGADGDATIPQSVMHR